MEYWTIDDYLSETFRRKISLANKLIADPATWIMGISYLFWIRKMRMECRFYDSI